MHVRVVQLLLRHVALVVQRHRVGELVHRRGDLHEGLGIRRLLEVRERVLVERAASHVQTHEHLLLRHLVDDLRLPALEELIESGEIEFRLAVKQKKTREYARKEGLGELGDGLALAVCVDHRSADRDDVAIGGF